MRSWCLSLILAVALLTTACSGCRDQRSAEAPATTPGAAADTHPEEENALHLSEDMIRDLRTSTAPVIARSGADEVTVLGQVAVDQDRYAEVTPPTGGQIVRVLVGASALVARGTPLVQLRSTELGRARADVMTADARLDLARQTLERKRALAAERIVAAREVQEAEATYRAAEAESRAAVAALRALGAEMTDAGDTSIFTVRSPLAGRVLDRFAVLGQYADPAAKLFTIADLSRVWVIAQAFERDAVRVQPGTVAHITLAALPGMEFDGRVVMIGRHVEEGSRTLPIRIQVGNASGSLRPGMSTSARLEIAGAAKMTLVVPAAALQRVGQRWLVFIPKGEREFEMRVVGRGRDLGNDVEVLSGLKEGEIVVVDGAFLLKAEAEKKAGGGDEHGHGD